VTIQAIPENLSLLLSHRQISNSVRRLAREINEDYGNQPILVIAVLKGSFIFLADLVRQIEAPIQLDFIRATCYGNQTEPNTFARIINKPQIPLKDKHILVVEDIVDTGLTTKEIIRYLNRKGTASIKLCTLLNKARRRQVEIQVDYSGRIIRTRKFLVGYGLDLAEGYRHLPDIYTLEE
jgi:hypoxanthine phosphoribosyltransferase